MRSLIARRFSRSCAAAASPTSAIAGDSSANRGPHAAPPPQHHPRPRRWRARRDPLLHNAPDRQLHLRAALGKSGKPSWRAIAMIGIQVAHRAAHHREQEVLHRDIKPGNLLLDNSGNVHVTDFGLARFMGQPHLTATGDLVGTLRYLAPERLRGWCDPRSDVYSLGLTLYELLTLRPAFDELERNRLLRAVEGRADTAWRAAEQHPSRPGDDRPQGNREGAGAPLPVRPGPGRRPSAVPRWRPHPSEAAEHGQARLALGPAAQGAGRRPAHRAAGAPY